jgi:methionyl-tRNA formyltransferase
VRSRKDLIEGDILFLISCTEIISKKDREKFTKSLIIHASDLPKGRGWSPHIWEIINGADFLTLSLIEVEDKVDTGDIWKKKKVNIPKTALFEEINHIVFGAEIELMDFAIENFSRFTPLKQIKEKASYWKKRTPKDSELNIYLSLDEQFDLIRVSDEDRFPAYFYKNGEKFLLSLKKIK